MFKGLGLEWKKKRDEEIPIVVVLPKVGISLNKYLIHRTLLQLSALSNCKLFNIKEHERCKEEFYNFNNAQEVKTMF